MPGTAIVPSIPRIDGMVMNGSLQCSSIHEIPGLCDGYSSQYPDAPVFFDGTGCLAETLEISGSNGLVMVPSPKGTKVPSMRLLFEHRIHGRPGTLG